MALAIFIARRKETIRAEVVGLTQYVIPTDLAVCRQTYAFRATCQGSVPEAIACFLETASFESCILDAVLLGGDKDTIAAMSGGIA